MSTAVYNVGTKMRALSRACVPRGTLPCTQYSCTAALQLQSAAEGREGGGEEEERRVH